MSTVLSPDLVAAYQGAHYQVNAATPFTLVIDQPSAELKACYAEHSVHSAAFITADNPFSEPTSAEQNEIAHQALWVALTPLAVKLIEGFGQDPKGEWPAEKSVLALGVDLETATTLGRQFKQNAIVWCGADAVAKLQLLK